MMFPAHRMLVSGGSLEPETIAILAQTSNGMRAYGSQMNDAIIGLKESGAWNKLIRLWVFAAPTDSFFDPTVNWVNPAGANNINGDFPNNFVDLYIQNRGLRTDIAEQASVRYTNSPIATIDSETNYPGILSDFSFGVWCLSNTQDDNYGDMGLIINNDSMGGVTPAYYGWQLLLRNNSNELRYQINSTVEETVAGINDCRGLYIVNRAGTTTTVSEDGNILATHTSTAEPYPGSLNSGSANLSGIVANNLNSHIGAALQLDYNANPPTQIRRVSGRDYALAFVGLGLTQAEQQSIHDSMRIYLEAFLDNPFDL